MQASLVWSNWARPFKFHTRINQDLKSCLVKVLSRSVDNCRFWSTLKIVDFEGFFSGAKPSLHASLVCRSWARAFKSYTLINQYLKLCLVKVSSRSVENCRFWRTLKIVDFLLFFRCEALCTREFGMKELSYRSQIVYTYKPISEIVPRQGFMSIGWKLSILKPLKNGKHFIFSRGNAGDNIGYYPLNMCVFGW